MRKTGLFLLICVVLAGFVMAQEEVEVDPRIREAENRLETLKRALEAVTNETDRITVKERLVSAEQNLLDIRRLVELEDQEETLATRREKSVEYLLREAYNTVNTDTNEMIQAIRSKNLQIRKLKDFHPELKRIREKAHKDGDQEALANAEMQLQNNEAETLARTLERDAHELSLRLAREAMRVEAFHRDLDVNPRPTLRLIHLKRQDLASVKKQLEEVELLHKQTNEQRADAATTLELAELRYKNAAEEVTELDQSLNDYPKEERRNRRVLLDQQRGMARLMEVGLKHVRDQREALALALIQLTRTRHLLEAEIAFREHDISSLQGRYLDRVKTPLLLVAGMVILYALLSRLVFPLLFKKDALFVARRLGTYILLLFILIVLIFFFLEDLKPIATILGILGAAIVIALQDLCSSFAGWFVIVTGRKLKIGDRVEINEQRGDVIDIQMLRTTLLEVNNWLGVDEPTGRTLVVPNSFVFKTHFFNYSHVHPFIWGRVDVTVTFESPANEARELLMNILKEQTEDEFAAAGRGGRVMEKIYGVTHATVEPRMHEIIEASGVLFMLFYVCHYKHFSITKDKISAKIVDAIDAHPTINFAYPTERHIPTAEASGFEVSLRK